MRSSAPRLTRNILLLLWDLSYFSYYSGFPISDDNEASWVGSRWIRIDHTKLMIWHFVNLSLKILRIDILTSRKPSHCHRLNEHHHLLYLSLKYEFVTPLTSLVVVKPDSEDYGDFGEAGLREKQRDIRQFDIRFASGKEGLSASFLVTYTAFIINYLLLTCTI